MARRSASRRPYPNRAMILLRLAGIPFIGLWALILRTEKGKAAFRVETKRLTEEYEGREAIIGRYLDSRDHADDDEPKELVLMDDRKWNAATQHSDDQFRRK
jgi:hypothetical protein